MKTEPLVEVNELRIGFPSVAKSWAAAVDGVSLAVGAGERVGLVGETGSGKSVTALACLGLIPEPGRLTGGSVKVAGINVAAMPEADLQTLRGGEIGYLFQEAADALNPVFTIGFQVAETIAAHGELRGREAYREGLLLLGEAALESPEEIAKAYPHELSGGQAQRVMLALALAGKPRLLIADEPTSALDSLTQAQVIEILDRLVTEKNMGLLLISHDLLVVQSMVDRVAVLFAGRIVEEGPARDVFSAPLHPYTRALLASVPGLRKRDNSGTNLQRFSNGSLPQKGCRFAERCGLVEITCREIEPDMTEIGENRRIRCPVVRSQHEKANVEG